MSNDLILSIKNTLAKVGVDGRGAYAAGEAGVPTCGSGCGSCGCSACRTRGSQDDAG